MEKIVRQGILYDFYGELLTEHQRRVYEAVVDENLSLGEIAGELKISRQAVHDLIRRTDHILEDYETKLKLIERFEAARKRLDGIEELVRADGDEGHMPDGKAHAVCALCDEIRDIL